MDVQVCCEAEEAQVAASATATESQRQWRAVLTGAERCLGNMVMVVGATVVVLVVGDLICISQHWLMMGINGKKVANTFIGQNNDTSDSIIKLSTLPFVLHLQPE